MQYKNKDVDKFFMIAVPKRNPEVLISDCHKALMNYYLELETPSVFNSADFKNETERAFAMFGFVLSEIELKMVSCKFYKSRSDKYGEDHEKVIKELEAEVNKTGDTELIEIMLLRHWWES